MFSQKKMLTKADVITITNRGIKKIAVNYGYKLSFQEKDTISKMVNALAEAESALDTHIIYILEQFERRLRQVHELKKEIAELRGCAKHENPRIPQTIETGNLRLAAQEKLNKAKDKLAQVTQVSGYDHPLQFVVEAVVGSIVLGCKAAEDFALWCVDFRFGAKYDLGRIRQIETIHFAAIDFYTGFKCSQKEDYIRLSEVFKHLDYKDVIALEKSLWENSSNEQALDSAMVQKAIYQSFHAGKVKLYSAKRIAADDIHMPSPLFFDLPKPEKKAKKTTDDFALIPRKTLIAQSLFNKPQPKCKKALKPTIPAPVMPVISQPAITPRPAPVSRRAPAPAQKQAPIQRERIATALVPSPLLCKIF